jgi:hypothetical protein
MNFRGSQRDGIELEDAASALEKAFVETSVLRIRTLQTALAASFSVATHSLRTT